MRSSKTRFLAVSAVIAASVHLSAQSVDAFLAPLEGLPPATTLSAEHPALSQTSAEGPGIPGGWIRFPFEGELTGYVAQADLDDRGLPIVGAQVSAGPSSQAPVFTLWDSADADRFDEPGPIVDGYLQVPLIRSLDLFAPAPQRNAVVGQLAPVEGRAEPEPTAATPEAIRPIVALPPPPPPTTLKVATTLSGRLEKAPRRWIFWAPPYRYQLSTGDGERIAWLDLETSLSTTPVFELVGKEVEVHGEWANDGAGARLVLEVQNVRPSF